MLKRDEIEDLESCFNKAQEGERLFVLLARDPAAPVAIRAWIAERIRLGKNAPGDEQIREAFECANLMELERPEVASLRRQQLLGWTWSVEGGVSISRFRAASGVLPSREDLSWADFVTLFAEPFHAACTPVSCQGVACPHKRGPCWSPAVFADMSRCRGDIAAISALVFDVDHATDDQLDEVRSRISGYRYLIHGTHSDLPNKRFVRIVVALSRPVAPEAWPVFWRAAQQRFVPIADPAGADAARIYFMPSCPRGAGYFVQVNEGGLLDVDALLALGGEEQRASFAAAAESDVSP